MQTKICTKCEEEKSLQEFSKDKQKVSGYDSWCKKCRSLYHNNWYKQNDKRIIIKSNNTYIKNKQEILKQDKIKRQEFPWKQTLKGIKQRCENINNPKYYRYGGRGIKVKITEDELKYLWFRDKAYLMKQPSIDREDNDGDYILDNCRYIELGKNSSKDNYLKRKSL